MLIQKKRAPNRSTPSNSTLITSSEGSSAIAIVILLIATIVILGGVVIVSTTLKKNKESLEAIMKETIAKSQVTIAEGDHYWYREAFAVGEQKDWFTDGKFFKYNLGGYPDCFEVKIPNVGWSPFRNLSFNVGEHTSFRRKSTCTHSGEHTLQVWNTQFTETQITKK